MGLEGFEIRPAESKDSEMIWPLVLDFATSYRPERPTFERSFRELLQRRDTLILIAEENGTTVVGYLLASCQAARKVS